MADKDDMKEKDETEETAEEASSTEEDEGVEETGEDVETSEEASDEESDEETSDEGADEEDASDEDAEASDDEADASEDEDSDEDASDDEADASEDEDSDDEAEAARAPEDADEGDASDDEAEAEEADEDEDDQTTSDDEDVVDEDLSAGVDVDVSDPEPSDDEEDEDGPLRGYAAYYEHPDHLMAAARHARDSKYDDFEAYSPFPIHGMDEAMGLERSWIPWVTFGAGLVGFVTANALQFGMMTFDWPMIIGGKPFAPWPSFVPVMFELTVLVAGVTTAIVMLKAAGCFQKADVIDERITNDRFVLWISADDDEFDEDEVESFLSDLNPLEIKRVHQ